MAKEFVTLHLDQFIQWADGLFGKDKYVVTKPNRGRESVIKKVTGIYGLELHVYTTVDKDNLSRGCGEDAIRFVLFDTNSGSPVGSARKVLRVEGNTSPFDRCTERLKELVAIAREMKMTKRFCDKCGSHLVERSRKSDGGSFFGCSLFPVCKPRIALNLQAVNVLRHDRYPLVDNPFELDKTEELPNPFKVRAPLTVSLEHVTEEHPVKVAMTGNVYEIADEDDLVSTETYPQLGYRFPYFNRMQSGVVRSNAHLTDCNLMLGTATSSGKTIAAELAIAAMLEMLN